MDELFKFLLQGEVTTTGLLLFVIFALLKGWVVPFWQVAEMKEKLKAYEEKAPELLKEVQTLIDLQKIENERMKEQPYKFIQKPQVVNQKRKPPQKKGEVT